jgi:2'-5' RNA ligase
MSTPEHAQTDVLTSYSQGVCSFVRPGVMPIAELDSPAVQLVDDSMSSRDQRTAVPSRNLVSHWTDMPEWDNSRRLWAVYLTFADQPALHAMVDGYQRALTDLPQLDLIERRWLHLTMLGVAFTDEIDRMQAAELTEDCASVAAQFEIPSLVCHRPELDYDSVTVPVTPSAELSELRHQLGQASLRVLGNKDLYRLPEPANGFDPHISIAYVNAPVAKRDVRARLESVEHPVTTMELSHVSLIELTRGDRTWSWHQEQSLPLKAAVPAVKVSAG